MSSSENDSEDDFKPSGSRAKGTKRKKSQKKRPCGKKARKDIIDRIGIWPFFILLLPPKWRRCRRYKIAWNQLEGAMEEFEALFGWNSKQFADWPGWRVRWTITTTNLALRNWNVSLLCRHSPRFLSLCKFVHSMLLILVVVEVLRSSVVGRLSGFSRQ